jgi:iron(III) transport system substrate-binding protein
MNPNLPLTCLLFACQLGVTQAQELNLYSARHYQTDEALYSNFTASTGIKINRIEAGDEQILERIRNEGVNSKADVILLVDAARLWKAEIDGMFSPVRSNILSTRLAPEMRSRDEGQGSAWFAISTRSRLIAYDKSRIKPAQVANYEDLAKPDLKGMVCTRSGAHPYMLSLVGALSEHWGKEQTLSWARNVVANFARSPRGGDTDQLRALGTGECAVALTNSYYLARLMNSTKTEDKALVAKIGFVMPNQASFGTHINVSGGGVAKHAPNRANAVRFMEYLVSDQAQAYLAKGNNEWPSVLSVKTDNAALDKMSNFKHDKLPISTIGRAQVSAQRLLDTAGWR